jgi:23S rRNA (cytosine1962-C5)-methyltransferase
MIVWRLKRGLEKKFSWGHPWVFSNELAHSPKSLDPGDLVELRDDSGRFLAIGYGHPNSLISFRVLSRDESDAAIDADFFYRKLARALGLRRACGLERWSHRLCFAEADGLPGLVVDRFVLAGGGEALVAQSSTAGMDRLRPLAYEALERLTSASGRSSGSVAGSPYGPKWIVASDDSSARRMEGLELEPKRVALAPSGAQPQELAPARILVQPGAPLAPSGASGREFDQVAGLELRADLIGGQKTGFFLDQRSNLRLAAEIVRARRPNGDRPLRILDLCCYVGQWGAQLAATAIASGLRAEVTLVDSSAKALALAVENARAQGAEAIAEKRDALETLRELPERSYDVVVCDPPAFVKKKKDLPTGQAAYAKLNREAMRRLAPGGLFVSCSCSGLLGEEDFRAALARAQAANDDLDLRFVARGSHAADHPQLPQFPQGSYLKCWIGASAATQR